MSLKNFLRNSLAIAEKEIKLNMRFKYDYFFRSFISPFKALILFLIVYNGFFVSGASNLGHVTKSNYIGFLFMGTIFFTLFSAGYPLFNMKFHDEKYWRTIQAFLIAPVNRVSLIIGTGISEFIKQLPILIILFTIIIIFAKSSFSSVILTLMILALTFLGILGFSLIYGTFRLVNENWLYLFDILFWLWGFLSCFYYPIDALPNFLHPLIIINPIYQGLFVARSLLLNGVMANLFWHMLYIFAFGIIMPLIGLKVFSKIIRKKGITGY